MTRIVAHLLKLDTIRFSFSFALSMTLQDSESVEEIPERREEEEQVANEPVEPEVFSEGTAFEIFTHLHRRLSSPF